MNTSKLRLTCSTVVVFAVFTGCSTARQGPTTAFLPTSPGVASQSPTAIGAVTPMRALKQKCPCLYVANTFAERPKLPSVTVYSAGAHGNAAPIQTISGGETKLQNPYAIALDGDRHIFVAAHTKKNSRVPSFAPSANGNAKPIQVVYGPKTGLNRSGGIALDASGNLYVVNGRTPSITVYASGAEGDALPIRTISGSKTGLSQPFGIALDGAGNIYVANPWNNSVTVYAAGAKGNVSPIETISGSATELTYPAGIALDSSGSIYVANSVDLGKGRVTVYASGANGNVPPIRVISGKHTKMDYPVGIALDGSDNIYVANHESNSITTYAAGENGNIAPIAILTGEKTGLSGPSGIIVR